MFLGSRVRTSKIYFIEIQIIAKSRVHSSKQFAITKQALQYLVATTQQHATLRIGTGQIVCNYICKILYTFKYIILNINTCI